MIIPKTTNKIGKAISKSKEELIFVFLMYIISNVLIDKFGFSREIISAFFIGGAFWGFSFAYIKKKKNERNRKRIKKKD